MWETVFARTGWIPQVVRGDGQLRVRLGAGADVLHQPRTFSFPISERHLEVIRDDLARHLLLWCAVLPLCDAAGTRGPLDEDAAVALLDPILLGAPAEVDAHFRETGTDTTMLVAHGADIRLLEAGRVFDSLHSATPESDTRRAQTYVADRGRARRGVHLGPLDEAVLKYVGHYVHGASLPGRHPDAVDPGLLPEVLRVIAVAEEACAGMRIRRDPRKGKRATDKQDWNRMTATVDAAVRRAYPQLADDALRSVSFLMCSDAADRSKGLPFDDDDDLVDDVDGSARKSKLTFTDEKGDEETWQLHDPRSAGAQFWEFVAARAGSGNQAFTIEDEELGEGIQLQFSVDVIARITTVTEGTAGTDPEYRVEYGSVDGMDGYRTLVAAFVRGGCAALTPYGPWTADADEFEQARRRTEEARP